MVLLISTTQSQLKNTRFDDIAIHGPTPYSVIKGELNSFKPIMNAQKMLTKTFKTIDPTA